MANMQTPSFGFESSDFSSFSMSRATDPVPPIRILPESSGVVEIKVSQPPLYFGPNVKELIERSRTCEVVIALLHVKFMNINYLALNNQGGHKGALDFANQQIESLGFKSYGTALPVGGCKALLLPEPSRILIFSDISNDYGRCPSERMSQLIKAALPNLLVQIDLNYLQNLNKKN